MPVWRLQQAGGDLVRAQINIVIAVIATLALLFEPHADRDTRARSVLHVLPRSRLAHQETIQHDRNEHGPRSENRKDDPAAQTDRFDLQEHRQQNDQDRARQNKRQESCEKPFHGLTITRLTPQGFRFLGRSGGFRLIRLIGQRQEDVFKVRLFSAQIGDPGA